MNNSPIACVILGGGGHARVLIDALLAAGCSDALAILDPSPKLHGSHLLGVPVLGDDALLPRLCGQGLLRFIVGVGSSSNNHCRRNLFDLGRNHKLEPRSVLHPRATCSAWANLGPGCQVLAGAIVNAGACLGSNVLINTGAIVEHDCQLEDHVHVATGARLAGGVRVGSGAFIGAGATVRQGVTIGSWAVVGAGAVVVRDVLPGSVVVGVPARPLSQPLAA